MENTTVCVENTKLRGGNTILCVGITMRVFEQCKPNIKGPLDPTGTLENFLKLKITRLPVHTFADVQFSCLTLLQKGTPLGQSHSGDPANDMQNSAAVFYILQGSIIGILRQQHIQRRLLSRDAQPDPPEHMNSALDAQVDSFLYNPQKRTCRVLPVLGVRIKAVLHKSGVCYLYQEDFVPPITKHPCQEIQTPVN